MGRSSKPHSNPLRIGKDVGSVMSWVMSGSSKAPIVGCGATELLWSDRHAYEVVDVSEDFKKVLIRRYKVKRADSNGMCDCQSYIYDELEGPVIELNWRYGKYMRKVWSPSWDQDNNCWEAWVRKLYAWNKANTPSFKEPKPYRWEKINIVLGIKEEYYDFSF